MLWEIPISKEVNLSGLTGKHFCFLPRRDISPNGPGHLPSSHTYLEKRQASSQWPICLPLSEPTLGPHLLFPANRSSGSRFSNGLIFSLVARKVLCRLSRGYQGQPDWAVLEVGGGRWQLDPKYPLLDFTPDNQLTLGGRTVTTDRTIYKPSRGWAGPE